jgi:tetratricopeptide (TPR) repeat protein
MQHSVSSSPGSVVHNMSEGVKLQEIREFTVQIRNSTTQEVVGTGFVVDEGIVTCAHVIRLAGVDPRFQDGKEVIVYFPEREGRQSLSIRAKIRNSFFPQHEDDVVLLELIDGQSPLGPGQVAKMGRARGSELNEFQSFGYRKLQNYQGLFAFGRIQGHIPKPQGSKLYGEPLMLSSQHIDQGMSGSPVLDIERNLIIGVVSQAWESAGLAHDRDTGLAVCAWVLSLDPLKLEMHDDLPKAYAPEPKIDIKEARNQAAPQQIVVWNNAPPSLTEWTGREQLLKDITMDWVDASVRITGLIGFGGEGKSSLARQWVDELLANRSRPQPEGIFWWGFYEKRNVDEFFNAALAYLSGGKIDAGKIPSANLKAQVIGAMLGAGRYLFVLDGLEVLQYQDGDMYGSIRSPDLKAFLEFFASQDHNSFCLVTSRAPLMDLISFSTYKHRDVDRLNPKDGRDLLRKLGVKGRDEELDRVVRDWDGHALTLSLLASYLKDLYGGDISQVQNIPPPTADEPPYKRVHRVLRRYDEHLSEAEKAFLKLFSAFRTPVGRDAFDKIFRVKSKREGWSLRKDRALNTPIAALDDFEFQAMVEKLVAYRILRYDPEVGYTAHPLIRAHYFTLLTSGDRLQVEKAHQQIKDYYLAKAQDLPEIPTLEDLIPLIEVVHHACQSGAYDEADEIHWEHINRGNESYIVHKLGAWETELEIMQEFFPGGDLAKDPLVSAIRSKGWILNEVGLCLKNIGRGNLVEGFYERGRELSLGSADWTNVSGTYLNLFDLYSYKGELARSLQAAGKALESARQAEDRSMECYSLTSLAWAYHLQGSLEKSSQAFLEAEALAKDVDSSKLFLCGMWGVLHADHLRCKDEADYARRVTEANLEICKRNHWLNSISRCQRVMGDLFVQFGQEEEAKESYGQALDIARSTSNKQVLVDALLARGRWFARSMKDSEAALSDLSEALEYARAGGYQLYEADIRIGLAWAHLAAGRKEDAAKEASYAKRMSEGMGYYWGKKDADEVLESIAED